MSYDFYLNEIKMVDVELYWRNYTCNVAGMWHDALGFDFMDLSGKQAKECIEPLEKAISNMKENPDKYKEMNPSNGREIMKEH